MPYLLELAAKYGDPFTCPLLGQAPTVVTWNPQGARALFGAPPESFVPGVPDALAALVGEGSLFLKRGDAHKRARKLLSPPFHGERLRAYARTIAAVTLRWLEKQPTDRPASMLEMAQGITLELILTVVFGAQDEATVRSLREAVLGAVEGFDPLGATFKALQRDFFGLGPWARFKRRLAVLEERTRGLLAARRARPGDDVVSLLLTARDEDGDALSEQEVWEQLLTFVVAGHETTAVSLAWALYELHSAPEGLAALRAELDAGDGPARTPEALSKLPYLLAACNETLRRHPPVPMVVRRCAGEFALGDYVLPAGHSLAAASYLAHHSESTFPEPFAFRPERFLERSYSPFEFYPFGGGARRCLGAAFATYELQLVLGTLLSHARFTLEEPKPVGNAFRIGTYGPATGVRMRVHRS